MNESSVQNKKTALHENHLKSGAKMVPFAGFDMPVSYTGVVQEHHAVRNSCGMFDVSHMGEFRIKGSEALDLIQWITSNDANKLHSGKVQYSCMPNGNGGIVDDLLIYCISATEFMLVVNASNREKDWNWIASQNQWDAEVTDESEEWSLIAVQGPKAAQYLQPIVKESGINQMSYYTFQEVSIQGKKVLLSATGYTGAGGFEIYLPNDQAHGVWESLLDAGVEPCGLGARDTLRMEAGFCLYGNDIDDNTSPIAAGLGWITKFTHAFVDCDRFEKEKAEGSEQLLRGLVLEERGIPRQGYDIESATGEIIGRITSGTQSPTLGQGIAMGYILSNFADLQETVWVRIRKKAVPARVVRPGFLPKV
ncbi:MAG: glycine cleavage system protein T [Crocinitomicaceae bacterium]|nr:glycine cleavage system protein T [Crocinitomicaceae bacterium]|tara:strand:+ start:2506 stop:3600 length:1095 start_codon:yes stop_codon:yes gene_type:complete